MTLDAKWVEDQCRLGELGPDVTFVVKKMIDALDSYTLPEPARQTASNAVAKLVRGESIAVEKPDDRWGPVIPGAYSIGDKVRVKPDAYSELLPAQRHNGRRGRVTAVRNGLAIVLYDDSPSVDLQHQHSPEKLQRLL